MNSPLPDTDVVMRPVEWFREPEHVRQIPASSVEQMQNSLTANGFLQPVGAIDEGKSGRLVWGVTRFRAAKAAKIPQIPTRLLPKTTTPKDELRFSLLENHVRHDEDFASTIARVETFAKLLGCSFQKAAAAADVKPAYLSKCRSIEEKLCPDAKQFALDHHIGVSLAYEVARHAKSEAQQMEAFMSIADGTLTRATLPAFLHQPSSNKKSKNLAIKVQVAGVTVTLAAIPQDSDYESLVKVIDTVKAKIIAHKKNKLPVRLLPELIADQT